MKRTDRGFTRRGFGIHRRSNAAIVIITSPVWVGQFGSMPARRSGNQCHPGSNCPPRLKSCAGLGETHKEVRPHFQRRGCPDDSIFFQGTRYPRIAAPESPRQPPPATVFVARMAIRSNLERLPAESGRRLIEMYLAYQPRGSFQGLPPFKDEVCVKWVREMLATGVHVVAIDQRACLIGHTGLFPINPQKCEMLVVVCPDYQNLGIGTQLVRSCIELAGELGFERIWLPVGTPRTSVPGTYIASAASSTPRRIRAASWIWFAACGRPGRPIPWCRLSRRPFSNARRLRLRHSAASEESCLNCDRGMIFRCAQNDGAATLRMTALLRLE